MSTVEEVSVVAAAAHGCDLAAVKADGDMVKALGLSRAPWLPDISAQVEP